MEGQYCLKWSNHHSNMLNAFGNLLNNELLCDVTVVCEGQSLKAHRLILSASSSFFHKIFLDNPCTNPIIIISDLKYADVRTLMDFMYNGHVSISENQLSSILKAAENLKIKGLGDSVENSDNQIGNHSSVEKSSSFNKHPSDFHKYSDIYSSQHAEGRTFSYGQQSASNIASNSSEIERSLVPIKNTNFASNSASSLDANMEIMPSNLLEQSMTTEDMCTEKPFNKDQSSSESSEINSESKPCHNVAAESLPASDSTEKDSCLNESFQCSSKEPQEDEKPADETIYTFKHEFMEDADKLYGSGQESSSGLAESFFDPVIHFSPGNLKSFIPYECLSENSKRGRKPGSRLCVLCKRVFNSENELETHMNDHRSGLVSTDSEGRNLTPETVEPALTQMTIEKSLLKLPTACSTCKYVMNTLNDAQNHIITNPNCRTSQFSCHVCPKTFIWPATLVKHFREQHESPDGVTRVSRRLWFFCDVCKKPLLSKHALSLHKKKFHGFELETYKHGTLGDIANCKRGRKRGTKVCGFCKRTFPENEYLLHVQSFHKNISFTDSSVGTPPCGNESLSSIDNESNSAQSTI